ncbi:hypothetical protein C1646_756659 [Rhizophagus diaphanus]|nr:hypothetical protein C1646_756659 [Rhizophagus diaphanus] [Rhizophagus sp. MUCL 43196]
MENNTFTMNNITGSKSSKHPIYLTLENILSWIRNKSDVKVLLGYLSQLKVKTISQKKSKSFKLVKQRPLPTFFEYINTAIT